MSQNSPAVGQRTWVGIGRQPNYVTPAPALLYHGIDSLTLTPKYAFIDRPEARAQGGRVLAAPGPYSMNGTIKVAPDPGAVEQWIAYAMGAQSTPTNMNFTQTLTTAAITLNASPQSVAVTAGTGTNFPVGVSVRVNVGLSDAETVTVTANSANSISGIFTKNHSSGAQIAYAAPAYQSTYSIAATPLSTASTASVTGSGTAQAVPVTSGTGLSFQVGQQVIVDQYLTTQEVVTITAVATSTISGIFKNAHASGCAITLIAVLRELPYFMIERYRDNDCIDLIGTAIDTMKVSVDMGGKLVGFEFGVVGSAQAPVLQTSPGTPSFATTSPYTSENGSVSYTDSNGVIHALGTPGQPPLQSVSIMLNNQLDKNYRTIGQDTPVGFPLGSRKVNGTMKMGFESNQAFLDWLSQGVTGLSLTVLSTSLITYSSGRVYTIPYQLTFTVANLRISQDVVSHTNSGPLDQTITFEAYSSGIGTNDDLVIVAQNAANAIY